MTYFSKSVTYFYGSEWQIGFVVRVELLVVFVDFHLVVICGLFFHRVVIN